MKAFITTSLFLSLACACVLPAISADDSTTPATDPASAVAPAGAASNTTAAAPPAVRTLEGEIQVVQLDLQDLREVALDMKRVRTALKHLYDEAARQPVTIQDEPEMIGDTIIEIPISFTGGGFLPPRKAWVDASMANITPFVALANKDVADFTSATKQSEFPDAVKDKMQPLIQQWATTTGVMSAHLAALQPLTAGPTYDNQAILDATKAMDGDLKGLEKTRKDMYKVLLKEGKRAQDQAKRAKS